MTNKCKGIRAANAIKNAAMYKDYLRMLNYHKVARKHSVDPSNCHKRVNKFAKQVLDSTLPPCYDASTIGASE